MVGVVVTTVWTAAAAVRAMVAAAERRDEVVRPPAIVEYPIGLIIIDPDTHGAIIYVAVASDGAAGPQDREEPGHEGSRRPA
jgi:hypothetical protein